jgi:hypothetical protein
MQLTRSITAIDIVIAGPPCVDYTLVNALRKGVDGKEGSYMLKTGELVMQIDNKMRRFDNRPVFFLAENTVISNGRDLPLNEGDLSRIQGAWDITWDLVFDSRMVSPIRRKRTYLSNIPFDLQSHEYCDPRPKTCFDDGFDIAANIHEKTMVARALGLMASPGRIDDSRMNIYKKREKKRGGGYEERKINVVERERLMGYPEGYVAHPGTNKFYLVRFATIRISYIIYMLVNHLFTTILDDGHAKDRLEPDPCNWNRRPPQKFLPFAGDYHKFRGKHPSYRFEASLPIKMKMAPPKTTKTVSAQRITLAFALLFRCRILRPNRNA